MSNNCLRRKVFFVCDARFCYKMPPKRKRSTDILREEVNKQKEQIKRRKNSLSVESTTTSKAKAEQLKALRQLLVEDIQVTTNLSYENTREETRVTKLVRSQRTLSVQEAVSLLFNGMMNSVWVAYLSFRCV